MKEQNFNEFFSIDRRIGNEIKEQEFMCLMADKRVWTTRCQFNNKYEAHAAIGGDIETFNEDSPHVYGGLIVTSKPEDWREAELIAVQRGFGETIEGVLYGIVPNDHQMVNPYDIKNGN